MTGNILRINAYGISTRGIWWALVLSFVVHAVAVLTLPGIRFTSSDTDDVLTVELDLPKELIEPRDVVEKETVPVPQQPSFSRPIERGINPPEDTPPIPLSDSVPPVERPRMDIPVQTPDVVSAPVSPEQSAPVRKATVSVPVKRVIEQIPVEPIVMNEPNIVAPVSKDTREVTKPLKRDIPIARRKLDLPPKYNAVSIEAPVASPDAPKPTIQSAPIVSESNPDRVKAPTRGQPSPPGRRAVSSPPGSPTTNESSYETPIINAPLKSPVIVKSVDPKPPIDRSGPVASEATPSAPIGALTEAEAKEYEDVVHFSLDQLIKKDLRRQRGFKFRPEHNGAKLVIRLSFDSDAAIDKWELTVKSGFPELDEYYRRLVKRLFDSGAFPPPPSVDGVPLPLNIPLSVKLQ